jgi:hypothetical protein
MYWRNGTYGMGYYSTAETQVTQEGDNEDSESDFLESDDDLNGTNDDDDQVIDVAPNSVTTGSPTVTTEAFIKDKYIIGGSFGPFMGDNRTFTDSPAGIDKSRYTLTAENGKVTLLQNATHLPFGVGAWAGRPVGGGEVKEIAPGVYTVRMNIIARDPYGFGMAPAVSNSVNLTINMNTGSVEGTVRHTSYPSLQVFVNGTSVLQHDQSVILGSLTMSTDKILTTVPVPAPTTGNGP